MTPRIEDGTAAVEFKEDQTKVAVADSDRECAEEINAIYRDIDLSKQVSEIIAHHRQNEREALRVARASLNEAIFISSDQWKTGMAALAAIAKVIQ